jgi:predicted kinase
MGANPANRSPEDGELGTIILVYRAYDGRFAMSPPLLTVISGGANTGKSLYGELLARHQNAVLICRDHVRAMLRATQGDLSELSATLATFAIARDELGNGRNVVAVGWNLDPVDREGWLGVAGKAQARFRWVTCEAPIPDVPEASFNFPLAKDI